MSNALRMRSYKNEPDLAKKVKILKSRYVNDFRTKYSRKPLQIEEDQLENLAILKITFDDILDRIKKGRDHKREYLSILARYQQLSEKMFGKKSVESIDNPNTDKSLWDAV